MSDGNAAPPATRGKRSIHAMAGAKTMNLALQGGGAHGAFTWGVLDRLLDDERIGIEGISATSAGAMNAVVAAYGLTVGGREGAKRALSSFWRRVAHAGAFSPLQPTMFDRLSHNHGLDTSPAFMVFDLMSRILSPYQFNPFNVNPLRQALEETVDFAELRKGSAVKLFISATNVRTGKIKVFETHEMTPDAVLASACLPFLFQAVEIDGEHYWDGGYMGNPAIFPLIYNCESSDIAVVHINPMERPDVPTQAKDILNRINEISFNSSLMREMRAIAFVTRLIDEQQLKANRMKRMLVHAIEARDFMQELSVSSKLNCDWEFLTHLRDVGHDTARDFLMDHYADINQRSSIDIEGVYL